MNVVPLIVLGALVALSTFLAFILMAAHAIRDTRHTIRTRSWQQQIPGLERIPLCTLCRVITNPGGQSERVPCKWHADIASQAIERQLTS